ncbi:MAG: nicotinate-nucleotide adenylyltransferase [Acidobacteriota bacterium]
MKLGIYGGSFDPIHYGHLEPAREAREALGLDRIIYLPTARPPHKPQRKGASALARFTMTELALLNDPNAIVSAVELEDRVSYTIETLEHFHHEHPEAQLVLILGSDSFHQLDRWREWRAILRLAELAVLDRPTETPQVLSPELSAELESSRVHTIANTPLAVSSTEIRRRLAARSQDLSQLVPQLVLDYIQKYDLYR